MAPWLAIGARLLAVALYQAGLIEPVTRQQVRDGFRPMLFAERGV